MRVFCVDTALRLVLSLLWWLKIISFEDSEETRRDEMRDHHDDDACGVLPPVTDWSHASSCGTLPAEFITKHFFILLSFSDF